MRSASAVIAGLALSACSTTEFYGSPPAETFASARSRAIVADCLMDRLATPEYAFQREELGAVTRVSLASSLGPVLAFDIRDSGGGSVIEMRRATSITLGQKTARTCF